MRKLFVLVCTLLFPFGVGAAAVASGGATQAGVMRSSRAAVCSAFQKYDGQGITWL